MRKQNRRRQRLSQRTRTRISFRKIAFGSATFVSVFIAFFVYSNFQKSEKVFAEGAESSQIAIKNFKGRVDSIAIELNWTTSSELNTDHFVIERSADGVEYYEIGRVQGKGTGTMENEYSYTDEAPLIGNVFYRLCQSTLSGTSIKFKPVQMSFELPESGFQILYLGPNPFDDNLRVDYNSEETGVIDVTLLNSKGQPIRSEQVITTRGVNSFIFGGVSSLSKGFYFIQLQQGNSRTPGLKVIKE